MKAIFEKITFPEDRSLRLSRFKGFNQPGLQYHPEYELVHIIQGTGIRLLGCHAESFGPGDTIFLGPNLPHWWSPNPERNPDREEAIVLQFGPTFFLRELLELPEFKTIADLRQNSFRCLSFDDKDDRLNIRSMLDQLLLESDPGLRWLGVMKLLKELSLAKSARPLLPESFENPSPQDSLEKAIQYILANLEQPLSMEGVAEITGVHPVTFSRRFKKCVQMTFPRFLRHHRIARVCQELHRPVSLAHLAHDHGFRNLSTFNRSFREEMNCSPREYRRRLRNSQN